MLPVPEPALAYFNAGKARRKASPVGDVIPEGSRHSTLLSLAGTMRRRGMGEHAILAALLVENEKGWPAPLPEAEVAALAVDVARRYEPAPPDPEEVELRRQADEFLREFEQGTIRAPSSDRKPSGDEKPWTKRRRELRRRATSAIQARAVEWLIPKAVPLRTITMVAGVGGLGKSALVLAWGAEVTREGSNVLIVSYEDAAEQVIRPRFEALNGDLDRLFELSIDPLDGSISFPVDLDELHRHAVETDARLVVIDPVSASLDLALDAHKDAHVRVVLGQLAKLAERLNLAVVMIAHLNKAPGADPYLRINGSTGFYNASRSVLTVTRDPLEDAHRLVAHHKSNYGLLAPVERWRLEVVDVPSGTGPIAVARLVFLEVADDVSRDDVLAPPPLAEKRSEAEALIMVELAQGRRLSSEVKAVGAKAGISIATIKRAAVALEVVIDEETTESGRVTYWALPNALGGRLTPYDTVDEPISPEPHNQAKTGVSSGGSAHESGKRAEPTPSGCHKHPDAGLWLARDGVWRCCQCEPPALPSEIVQGRRG